MYKHRFLSKITLLTMVILTCINLNLDFSALESVNGEFIQFGNKVWAATYTDSFSFNTGTNYYPYNMSPNVACGVSGSVSYTIDDKAKTLLISSYTFNSLGSTTYRSLYAYFYQDTAMTQPVGSKLVADQNNSTSGSNITINLNDLTGPFCVIVFKCYASYGTNPNYSLFYNGTGSSLSGLVVRTLTINSPPNINVISPNLNDIYSSNNANVNPRISISDADNDTLTSKVYIDSEAQPRQTLTITNTTTAQNLTFSSINVNPLSESTHSIRFDVSDGKTTVSKSVNIIVDRSGPVIGKVNIDSAVNKIVVSGSSADSIGGLDTNPYQYVIDQNASAWLPSEQTNSISSSVINTAYDTSGNGGRKLVRLNNGTLVAIVKDTASTPKRYLIYTSTNNGVTWSMATLNPGFTTALNDVSIATDGNYIMIFVTYNNLACYFYKYDSNIGYISSTLVDEQTAIGNCSLAIDSSGNLHAVWASKNSTYPNSFNIRYSKSTDGGKTWAAPTQITDLNISYINNSNPCIAILQNGDPIILFQYNDTNSPQHTIRWAKLINGSWLKQWDSGKWVYNVYQSYMQSNPCVVVDSSGIIYSVWFGYDSTDTSKYNIRYSKSTDNGITWSTPIKLTSGNSYNQINPIICADNTNKLYVYWQGTDPAVSSSNYNIRRTVFNGSTWGIPETLSNNTTNNAQNPSICSNVTDFTNPLYIYQDQQANAIKFSGQLNIPATPFEVTNLQPNTPHVVTFKAKDKAGNISTWSQTVYTKAMKPTLTILDTVDTNITLKVNDTNPTDTQYLISCGERYVNQLGEITSEASWIEIPDKTITISGLDNHVQYFFKINARNGNGIETNQSDSITGTTGTPKPSIPENITTQPKSNSITVVWDEVLGATSYDVEADGIVHNIADNLYYTHEGLNSETTHIYRVRARIGDDLIGDWSQEYVAETLKALPPAINGLTALKSSTTVQLNWNEISGGGVVYQVQADGKVIDIGFENSHLDQNLTVDSRHTYRVRAVNSAGAGPWSSPINVTTQFVAPTTPTNIVGVGSKTKIVVTWDKVFDTTNYYLEAKCNNPNINGTLIDNKNSTYGVIYGSPNTTYYIRIKAKNPAGESEWSEPITVKTYALETPAFSNIQESQHEVTLNWTLVTDAVTYKIERDGKEIGSTDKLTYTDTGLTAETTYSYRIKAVGNDSKDSNWSYSAEAITLPEKPPVPQDFYAVGSNGMVTLSWALVEGAIAYDLEIDGVIIENGDSTSYLYKDVASKTEHFYRVRARNSGIEGDWHPGIRLTTLPDTIQPPSNINVSTTNTVTTVKWESVPDAIKYEVEVDGMVVYSGTRNEYVHRRLDPNKEHVYRIRSIGYVESSDWSDQIVNNAVTLVCDKGKYAQIGLTASDVTDFSGYTLTVTYNPDVLQVDDLCTLTSDKELIIGKIKGTDVEIIQFEQGKIVFKVDKPIELGMSWSGIINRIGFKGKVTGGTTITYTVFIQPKTQ